MPGVDGLEAARRVLGDPGLGKTCLTVIMVDDPDREALLIDNIHRAAEVCQAAGLDAVLQEDGTWRRLALPELRHANGVETMSGMAAAYADVPEMPA